jgi:3-oxocholest-4-en-26-oate---CoA ligase
VELHGRDSVTINSGGEKIFAEEVEAGHQGAPLVYDCVVAGRPSERWGNEVVALVRVREWLRRRRRRCCRGRAPHRPLQAPEGRSGTSTRSSARPAGKADYRWAKQVAASLVDQP